MPMNREVVLNGRFLRQLTCIIEVMISQVAGKLFRPVHNPEGWRPLLAESNRHWKANYSAEALVYCWQEAQGFLSEARQALLSSRIGVSRNIQTLLACAEYKIPLPRTSA
jgi:hypothetical protein